jgi:rhodanese-related sulfurtransferase
MQSITPQQAAALMRGGALAVDVREPDEHAREAIAGAVSLPLSRLGVTPCPAAPDQPLLFHCKSGARTEGAAAALADLAGQRDAFVLAGGLDAWKQAGLPVRLDRRQPMPLMRQVQIAAGSLGLLGVVLGVLVSPGFYALSAFVGAGQIFAGVSGTCMMADLLRRMPWNAVPAA